MGLHHIRSLQGVSTSKPIFNYNIYSHIYHSKYSKITVWTNFFSIFSLTKKNQPSFITFDVALNLLTDIYIYMVLFRIESCLSLAKYLSDDCENCIWCMSEVVQYSYTGIYSATWFKTISLKWEIPTTNITFLIAWLIDLFILLIGV